MVRPVVSSEPHLDLVVHLREVAYCSGQIWVFGNTAQRVSVGVLVTGFEPYFFLEQPAGLILTVSLHPGITRLTEVQKLPVIGFDGGKKLNLLQVHYRDYRDLPSIRQALAKCSWSFGGRHRAPLLYHEDWSLETLLTQTCNIHMQEWVQVESFTSRSSIRSTSCQWEVTTNWQSLRPTLEPCTIPPVLVGAVRMKRISALVVTIGLESYWLGHVSEPRISMYTGSLAAVLRCFAEEVNRLDVDCFCVFTDSLSPLDYNRQINLSKFTLSQFHCHGRSNVDLKKHVAKMTLVPTLQYHTLAEAAQHPQLVRTAVVPLSFNEEVSSIVRIEKDGQVILGYLQLSRVCHGPLTLMVTGGQQIRVWGKLQNKIFEQGLVVNREKLLIPPLKVQCLRSHSSFPQPPSLALSTENSSMGGYISPPKTGVHTRPTMVFDFASFYISIIQSDNVCPMTLLFEGSGEAYLNLPEYTKSYVPVSDTECLVLVVAHLGRPVESVLPQTAAELSTERIRLKQEMTSLDAFSFQYQWLNAQQLAYKCLQSSLFGVMGAAQENRYLVVPAVMKIVCMIGQFMIKKVKHCIIHEFQADVVYGDTDSLMVQCDATHVAAIQAATGKMFKSPHRFVLEKVLTKLILYKSKHYATLENQDGKPEVVIKGLSQRRSLCPWVRKVVQQVVKFLLLDQSDKITGYVDTECTNLSTLSVLDLSITCAMKTEYHNDKLIQVRTAAKLKKRTGRSSVWGDRLAYVVLAGSEPLWDRGEDPIYAEAHQRPLDKLYYLDNQLRTALESVLVFSSVVLRQVSAVLDQHRSGLRSDHTGVPTLMSMSKKQKLSQSM
jgi:DNA polymerase elongation subunit (family B)